jgi:hypothetical protein
MHPSGRHTLLFGGDTTYYVGEKSSRAKICYKLKASVTFSEETFLGIYAI